MMVYVQAEAGTGTDIISKGKIAQKFERVFEFA